MPRHLRLTCLVLFSLTLCACAALPPGQQRDPRDRFERMNRSIYRFNDALDRNIARPLASAYVRVTPQPVRTGVSNFVGNLVYPTTIVNDLLQGKPLPFVRDTARLVVNTTLGIGGLFDPATKMGLAENDEDFGQTLGRWGVPAGPYIVMPILGPSTVRDTFGWAADQFTDPKNYMRNPWWSYGLSGLTLLDRRANLLQADSVLQQSFDPYSYVRNAYLQHREYEVKDGAVPDEGVEIIEDDSTPATPAK
jgi:phospholipid-binding lipoprotein MlaA